MLGTRGDANRSNPSNDAISITSRNITGGSGRQAAMIWYVFIGQQGGLDLTRGGLASQNSNQALNEAMEGVIVRTTMQ